MPKGLAILLHKLTAGSIAAPFRIARQWKQFAYLSTNEWVMKVWYILQYNKIMLRKTPMNFSEKCVDESRRYFLLTLCVISNPGKQTLHVHLYVCILTLTVEM